MTLYSYGPIELWPTVGNVSYQGCDAALANLWRRNVLSERSSRCFAPSKFWQQHSAQARLFPPIPLDRSHAAQSKTLQQLSGQSKTLQQLSGHRQFLTHVAISPLKRGNLRHRKKNLSGRRVVAAQLLPRHRSDAAVAVSAAYF